MVVFENINEYAAYIEINVHTQYIESIENTPNRCMHTERLEERLNEDDQGNAKGLGWILDCLFIFFFTLGLEAKRRSLNKPIIQFTESDYRTLG